MTEPAQNADYVPCLSVGPRIGSEAPRCKHPKGHQGKHEPAPEDGWPEGLAWSAWWERQNDGSGAVMGEPREVEG